MEPGEGLGKELAALPIHQPFPMPPWLLNIKPATWWWNSSPHAGFRPYLISLVIRQYVYLYANAHKRQIPLQQLDRELRAGLIHASTF
ncbi:MAG: hypothetical protein VKK63_05840 [Synechococcus sp.]|nr:hypothetical protein [Synechococcus sp.]